MDTEWLGSFVNVIMSICAVAAIVECAAGDDSAGDNLRMICGLSAVSAMLRAARTASKDFSEGI